MAAVINKVDKKVLFKASLEKWTAETIFNETLDTEKLDNDKDAWTGPYVTPKKMHRGAEFYVEQFSGKNRQERLADVTEGWPTIKSTVEKVKSCYQLRSLGFWTHNARSTQ